MKVPGKWEIEDLFIKRPKSLELFHHVRAYIESLGAIKIEAMKTQISFGTKRKFAWVWLPQMWTKTRAENSITLTFDLPKKIVDQKIAVKTRPGHYTHHVIIQKKSDLDSSVKKWLRESHIFSQSPSS
jgi:hypothetical protein